GRRRSSLLLDFGEKAASPTHRLRLYHICPEPQWRNNSSALAVCEPNVCNKNNAASRSLPTLTKLPASCPRPPFHPPKMDPPGPTPRLREAIRRKRKRTTQCRDGYHK